MCPEPYQTRHSDRGLQASVPHKCFRCDKEFCHKNLGTQKPSNLNSHLEHLEEISPILIVDVAQSSENFVKKILHRNFQNFILKMVNFFCHSCGPHPTLHLLEINLTNLTSNSAECCHCKAKNHKITV